MVPRCDSGKCMRFSDHVSRRKNTRPVADITRLPAESRSHHRDHSDRGMTGRCCWQA
jgi:hypothetical protein